MMVEAMTVRCTADRPILSPLLCGFRPLTPLPCGFYEEFLVNVKIPIDPRGRGCRSSRSNAGPAKPSSSSAIVHAQDYFKAEIHRLYSLCWHQLKFPSDGQTHAPSLLFIVCDWCRARQSAQPGTVKQHR